MASSSSQSGLNVNVTMPEVGKKEDKDLSWYLPLYKAALKDDWERARRFFELDPDAGMAKITTSSETILHRAVGMGKAIHFVEKLLEFLPSEALALTNEFGDTALHFAAKFGNVNAANLLVTRNPHLPNTENTDALLPIHVAALFGYKEMVVYLLTVTKDDVEPNPFAEEPGVKLLNIVIYSGFYDVALHLVRHYPKLASWRYSTGNTPLNTVAGQPLAFPSGSHLSFWQSFIYSCVSVKLENLSYPQRGGDLLNPADSSQIRGQIGSWQFRVCQKLHAALWEVIGKIVPHVKHIRETKLMHQQTIQLVRCLCMEAIGLENTKAAFIFKSPIISAARLGIHEIVEEILKAFPTAIWSLDREGHDIFQLAVINRRETVFNLLHQMSEHSHLVAQISDVNRNNILHLAGKLAPPHRLNLVPGAALQMQRELQWYKEVEKIVQLNYREKENSSGKTPAMVFTEEHKDLVSEGEKWMKDTAKSCTFAAALIATVVFAAAITVPGGNNGDSGLPIFSEDKAFKIFAIADALSLFSSIASLLMFLSILTSRYSEADFLYALPKMLIIGLLMLILSVTSMLIAFSATLHLAFGDKRKWILISMAVFACLPMSLQLPLVVDVIQSTYGSGIFGRSELPFYQSDSKARVQ